MQPRWQLVQNPTGDALPSKPIGGLWTSSQLPAGTSGTRQPIIDSGYLGATMRHVITPLELHLEDVDFRVERDRHNLCRNFHDELPAVLTWTGLLRRESTTESIFRL